jgi:hypothetical protein
MIYTVMAAAVVESLVLAILVGFYVWVCYKDWQYEKNAMSDGIRMPQAGEKWKPKSGGGIPVYVVKTPVDPDDLVVAKNLKNGTRTWTMSVSSWHDQYELCVW